LSCEVPVHVLVTGAFGNIGSHTVPELVRRGHRVRCFCRLSTEHRRLAGELAGSADVMWGDVTDPDAVARAVAGVDTVVHLAALIPPGADERPDEARATNVDGTANVIAACDAQATPPRLLFTSTFDVHGYTLDRPPPRHVDDPLVATNPYTEHKIECEALVRGSGLDWSILRLADVPILGIRDPHPIMFEIGLDNRIESPAMGVEPLPEQAFSDAVYATDWLDTTDSEALLAYQRHTFDDIAEAIARSLGWKRRLVPLAGPFARNAILRLSPYWTGR
jgi:UDP-glucose 4-epimerase